MEDKKKTLYDKIVDVMTEVQKLQKDDTVEFKSTRYRALSEEKVTSIMHAQLVKHRIAVFPIKMDWSREGIITHVDVTYRITNADDPADYIEVVSCGDGADTQDKGSGKAMTYAYKYMWLRTFAIPTGEDPDKISSDEIDAKQERITEAEACVLEALCREANVNIPVLLEQQHVKNFTELTAEQYAKINKRLAKRKEINALP